MNKLFQKCIHTLHIKQKIYTKNGSAKDIPVPWIQPYAPWCFYGPSA